MQSREIKNVIEHSYFAIGGFDMNGGDVQIHVGFSSFEEAIIQVKNKINYNESLCGMISKNQDNSYTIFIKRKTNTKPSHNRVGAWKCTNIFYGRRMTSKSNQLNRSNESQNFDYFMVNGLDMWGGDLMKKRQISSFEQGFEQIKALINFDSTKCGSICYRGQNNFTIYLKDPKETNPMKSKDNHWRATTVFFGRTV